MCYALQTLQVNELARLLAALYSITVSSEEVDDRLNTILGFDAKTVAERESKEDKDNIQ